MIKKITLLFSVLFFGSLGSYLVYSSMQEKYVQIVPMLLGIIFLIVLLFNIVNYFLKKSESESEERNSRVLLMKIVFLFLSLFVFYLAYHNFKDGKDPESHELVILKSRVVENESYKGVTVVLESFPNFTFKLNHDSYIEKENPATYMVNVKQGDSVEILIRKKDFLIKIKEEMNPDLIDKMVNYKFIDVYGLKEGEEIYLSPEYFYKNRETNSFSIFIEVLLGVIFLGASLSRSRDSPLF